MQSTLQYCKSASIIDAAMPAQDPYSFRDSLSGLHISPELSELGLNVHTAHRQ